MLGIVVILVAFWGASIGLAVSGLLGASAPVRSDHAMTAISLEHSAKDGWLTDDDQANMYVALAALRQPRLATLMAQTWHAVTASYAAVRTDLARLHRSAPTAADRAFALQTSVDVASYDTYTNQVRRDVLAGNPTNAVRVMTVGNLAASNRASADFSTLAAMLTKDEAAVKSRVLAGVNSAVL